MTHTLEQKTKKVNWKHWLPIYGIYKTLKDEKSPILEKPTSFCIHGAYQAVSVFLTGQGLYSLAEKLF